MKKRFEQNYTETAWKNNWNNLHER
jgi:hypothetical protein